MNSIYPLADYQAEAARRQDEMLEAEKYRLAKQCPRAKKTHAILPVRLVNFLLLVVPFIKR